MRSLITAFLLALTPTLDVSPTFGQLLDPTDREVFTREQLEAVGMERLSELMPWLGTSVGTVEGLNWMVSVDDLPPDHLFGRDGGGPAIFVDGQPVMISVHGATIPELLPVSIPQIDSVVVIRAPGISGGVLSSRGSIHFHTTRPPRGPSFRSWARHGAETGDPGPYRYTPRATPNIDRAGPDRVGVLAYGGQRWDMEASARSFRTGLSDSLVWAGFGEFPNVFGYARGGAIRLGAEAGGGRHQLLVSRAYEFGQTYLPEIHRVKDTQITLDYLGIGGTVATRDRQLAYRATHNDISTDPFSPGPSAGHERTHASADLRAPMGPWTWTGGLAFDRLSGEGELGSGSSAGDLGTTTALNGVRTSAGLLLGAEHTSTRTTERLYGSVRWVEGEWTGQLGGLVRHRLAGRRAITATASYSAPGADFTYDSGEDFSTRRGMPGYAHYRASLGIEDRLQGFGAAAALVVGNASAAAPDATESAPPRPEGSSYVGLNAQLSTPTSSAFYGRATYRGIHPLPASERLPALSRHTLRGYVHYSPHSSIRLGAATLWKSAADWPSAEYGPLGGTAVEPVRRLDLSVEKWFWAKRIRTQLIIGNVLMTPERYHPSGADYAFRYFIGGSLDLPTRE